MNKINKMLRVIQRSIIFKINYFNPNKYMDFYSKYLVSIGVDTCSSKNERATYIDPSAYLDGTDYRKIHIKSRVVISRKVTILTHDLSLQRVFYKLGIDKGHMSGFLEDIYIDENSFIGANATLLPGTYIGKNSIVGANTVCKGQYPDNSIIIGNPAKVIGNSLEWGKKKYDSGKYKHYR